MDETLFSIQGHMPTILCSESLRLFVREAVSSPARVFSSMEKIPSGIDNLPSSRRPDPMCAASRFWIRNGSNCGRQNPQVNGVMEFR
jgi:hypothetical protein